VFIGEGRISEAHLRPQGTEALLRIDFLDLFDDSMDAVHHGAQVHGRKRRQWQAELRGPLHQRPDGGRPDERLRGHASEMQAVASELRRFLDQDRLRAELRTAGRRREAGSTAAEDSQVVVETCHTRHPFPSPINP